MFTMVAQALADSTNFGYTGAVQTFTAPTSASYTLAVWGAQGSGSTYGGPGGYSYGNIHLTKDEEIYIYVGGQGLSFNGGGAGYSMEGHGGGATDIRTNSDGNWKDDLTSRVIVAGGGGGAYLTNGSHVGGYGGGTVGGSATWSVDGVATGGSQSAGGLGGGSLGTGGSYSSSAYAGGGGGGYYGGGTSNGGNTAGSGGSGYIGGVTGGATIAGNTSFLSPTGQSEVGHSGSGYAIITLNQIDQTAPSIPTGLHTSGDTLSWAANPAGDNITSYTVYNNGSSIGTSTSPSYSLTSLASGIYSLSVSATNSLGASNKSYTTNYQTGPTNLQASLISDSDFTL